MPQAQQIKTMLSLMSRLIWTAERLKKTKKKKRGIRVAYIDDTAAPPSGQWRWNTENCQLEKVKSFKTFERTYTFIIKEDIFFAFL